MDEWQNNPADKPGAIVFRPDPDPLLVYEPKTEVTIDTRNGDRFAYKSGHGAEPAFFNLASADGKLIVHGNIQSRGLSASRKSFMFEIVRAKTGLGKSPDVLPDELELSRIAQFMRAWRNGIRPDLTTEVIVVDNREYYARREPQGKAR
jgi:hypothetical protein